MKIKIISATKGIIPQFTWYANRIGEEFDVVQSPVNDPYGIYVHNGDEQYPIGRVHSVDCQILNVEPSVKEKVCGKQIHHNFFKLQGYNYCDECGERL